MDLGLDWEEVGLEANSSSLNLGRFFDSADNGPSSSASVSSEKFSEYANELSLNDKGR